MKTTGLECFDMFAMPPCDEFATIVADPPWDIKMIGTCSSTRRFIARGKWGDPRQASAEIKDLPYPTLSVAEICALKVPSASDAHCYIWTINKYVEAAYAVARAWGFTPSKLLTWVKMPMGLGLGGAFCNTAEFCLFARKGSLPTKKRIDTTWWRWKRGRHSEKPEEFQAIVESVSPGPYLEMFARRRRLGWYSFGNEVLSDVSISAHDLHSANRQTLSPARL